MAICRIGRGLKLEMHERNFRNRKKTFSNKIVRTSGFGLLNEVVLFHLPQALGVRPRSDSGSLRWAWTWPWPRWYDYVGPESGTLFAFSTPTVSNCAFLRSTLAARLSGIKNIVNEWNALDYYAKRIREKESSGWKTILLPRTKPSGKLLTIPPKKLCCTFHTCLTFGPIRLLIPLY